jgi:hypothetical protein
MTTIRKLLSGGAAMAVAALILAPAGHAGILDPVLGPGLVTDVVVDVSTHLPDDTVIADFEQGDIADIPALITAKDEGAVPTIFGGTVDGTVPDGLEIVPAFTDCDVDGQDFSCGPVSTSSSEFNLYLRTSAPAGTSESFTICAEFTPDAIEGLIEYAGNNSDCVEVTVVDTQGKAVAALEPGECLLVADTAVVDTHKTCNIQGEDGHPIITMTEYVDNTTIYTCEGETCAASSGWKTGQILAPGYSEESGFSILNTVNFGLDHGNCQGIGPGSPCAGLLNNQGAGDFALTRTPWCYGDNDEFTPEALANVACITKVKKVNMGGGKHLRTWEVLTKIVDDPVKLPLKDMLGG